jgi:hypothetical protein
MRSFSYPFFAALSVALLIAAPTGVGRAATIDGNPAVEDSRVLPSEPITDVHGNAVDIVGGTSNSGSATGRAKGNSYQVDISVTLEEVEFWLTFSTSQTLTYYVFVCPDEFGTYTEIYRDSEPVAGTGAGWYSTGPISVDLDEGYHYIIAVSWDGTLTYYYNTGESQATSFGSETHGYAVGYDPLPSSFQSTSNDQAIYYQSLTTSTVSLYNITWGSIKSLF